MIENKSNGSNAEVQVDSNSAPTLSVLAQYTKDLSFENPNAPRSLASQEGAPEIQIQVNVNAKHMAESDFEVVLMLEGSAATSNLVFFKFDLHYAGVFRVKNVPDANVHPIIMIECPRLLFPFARQIIAEAVRGGGFPPLYIDPIDFQVLYGQRMAELQSKAAPTP